MSRNKEILTTRRDEEKMTTKRRNKLITTRICELIVTRRRDKEKIIEMGIRKRRLQKGEEKGYRRVKYMRRRGS